MIKAALLILADCTLAGKPTSDILYIGKSKKPSKRVFGGYLLDTAAKQPEKSIQCFLMTDILEKVTISWMISDDPKVTQQELLKKFKKEHGEYPAWNILKKMPPKPQPKPKATPKVAKPRPTANKSPNQFSFEITLLSLFVFWKE